MRLFLTLGVAAVAFVAVASQWMMTASAGSEECRGSGMQGPWYSFQVPEGMTAIDAGGGKTEADSIWLQSGSGPDRVMFFLFAPRQGGKPYQAYVDSENVTNFVDIATEDGAQVTFTVDYKDGSSGLFQGTSQKITGFRVFDRPMSETDLSNFKCFEESIEQYVN